MATGLSPFQVVYGVNLCTPLDLTPISTSTKFSWEANKRVKEIQELHAKVRARIEKFNEHNKIQANKSRRDVQFKPGDLVWIHLRKERFPSKRKSELIPRSDGLSKYWKILTPMPTRSNCPEIMEFPPPSMWLICVLT